ncbi:6976_t:CDS:2, partial [Racocetra persica]
WIESATIVEIDVVNNLYGRNMLIGWLRRSSAVMKVFSKSYELFNATIVGIDVVNDLYGRNMLIGWLRQSSA